MAKKSKRIVYRVMWKLIFGKGYKGRAWVITRAKKKVDGMLWGNKADAVFRARKLARAEHDKGALTQLVIHKMDGKIQSENTYGKDPRRTKG